MVHNAERLTGPVWALENDPRITRIGSFLRKTHLDNLPSLINVLKADMAIVGPSAERSSFIKKIERNFPNYHRRLKIKPGLTGLGQVKFGYTFSVRDAGKRLRYDLLYIERMCATLDLKIIYWSFISVLKYFYNKPRGYNAGRI